MPGRSMIVRSGASGATSVTSMTLSENVFPPHTSSVIDAIAEEMPTRSAITIDSPPSYDSVASKTVPCFILICVAQRVTRPTPRGNL